MSASSYVLFMCDVCHFTITLPIELGQSVNEAMIKIPIGWEREANGPKLRCAACVRKAQWPPIEKL